jgi:hypothetical protein
LFMSDLFTDASEPEWALYYILQTA